MGLRAWIKTTGLPLLPRPTPLGAWKILGLGLATGLAIFCAAQLGGGFAGRGGRFPLLASMGASAIILFAVPQSPMARPWSVVAGQLLSAAIGVTAARHLADPASAAAVAVGLSLLAMHLGRCLHPPGGASALAAVLGGEDIRALGYGLLLTPMALNLAALVALAELLKRFAYPPRAVVQVHPSDPDPTPLERLGIRPDDIRAALREMKAFVDVEESGLNEIYQLAAKHAHEREPPEPDCAAIMTRRLVTVEFGSSLEETWALMRRERVKAVPVVDRGNRVIGIVTLADFFRHARVERFDGLGGKLARLIRATPGVTSDKPEVAGQIMSAPALTAREDAPIGELVPLLCERGIHQIPIVDGRGKLSGLITQSDLIAALHRPRGRGGEPRR